MTCTVRPVRNVASVALLFLICATLAHAERLPFTTYTAAQGLPGTEVNVALEDTRGFLWLGTDKGLSRFDGWSFRTFGKEQGLSKLNVVSLALGADGSMWVGAWGGAFRFDPERGGSFVEIAVEGSKIPLERVQMFSDPNGQIWCVADVLYRLDAGQTIPRFRRVPFGPKVALTWVTAFLPDHAGNLWVAFHDLYRVAPDGTVLRIGTERGAELGEVTSLVEDRRGRIWAGTPYGLWRVQPPNGTEATEIVLRPLLETDPAKTGSVRLVAGEHGGVWSGGHAGLTELDPDAGVYRTITPEQGLATKRASPLLIDRAGDLWSAGLGGGIQRLAAEGFSSFGSADGLEASLIRSIWRRRTGDLVVVGGPDLLQRYDGTRFIPTHPAFPSRLPNSWGWFQIDMEDRQGNWWIPTAMGLVRFSPVKQMEDLGRARPAAVYGVSGCFPGGDIFRVYEDARADIWIGTVTRDQETIYRWTRSSGRFSCYSSASFLGMKIVPTAFLDVGHGTVWIAFYGGQIGRYRNGQFECLFDCTGTQGIINGLFLDRRKRLWIATSRAGVVRVDDTVAEHPRFIRLTTDNGLSSDLVGAVTQDRFDRIYIGTDRGVDVLEEASGRIRHFGIAEGLPHFYVSAAYADPHGDLWFGTLNGLARFTPPTRFRDVPPPRVLVDMVHVSGVAQALSTAGEERIDGLVLARDQRDIAIDFVGLPRNMAGTLKFQYRLSEAETWSTPSPSHSIVLAGLSTGFYRVEIRALDPAGAPSPQAAVVSLRVLAPFYQRSWFIILAVLSAVALTTAAYRSRVARLMALERQRTRLAMDLHDEMGSRLGSIGLLADVAGDDSIGGLRRKHLLNQIAETAAELGSSLTDIVWSLRPGEITVEGLGRHLAEHGRRLFPGPGTAFEARFPQDWANVEMSLAARRNVFLIGLEALHNAARHSGARRVMLEIRRQSPRWYLSVSDDGRGITEGAQRDLGKGFGFETVKRRAREIGALLDIQSRVGEGTTVTLLFVPHAEDHRLRGHMYIREIWKRIRGMS